MCWWKVFIFLTVYPHISWYCKTSQKRPNADNRKKLWNKIYNVKNLKYAPAILAYNALTLKYAMLAYFRGGEGGEREWLYRFFLLDGWKDGSVVSPLFAFQSISWLPWISQAWPTLILQKDGQGWNLQILHKLEALWGGEGDLFQINLSKLVKLHFCSIDKDDRPGWSELILWVALGQLYRKLLLDSGWKMDQFPHIADLGRQTFLLKVMMHN